MAFMLCVLAALSLLTQVFVLSGDPENNYGQGYMMAFLTALGAALVWLNEHFVP